MAGSSVVWGFFFADDQTLLPVVKGILQRLTLTWAAVPLGGWNSDTRKYVVLWMHTDHLVTPTNLRENICGCHHTLVVFVCLISVPYNRSIPTCHGLKSPQATVSLQVRGGVCMTRVSLCLCLGSSCGFYVGFTLVETVCQTGYDEIQLVKGFLVTSNSLKNPPFLKKKMHNYFFKIVSDFL